MATQLSHVAPDESQSHAQASEHHITGLGELLRSARARRGLTLQQVGNETKIPRRYLEALEQDRLEALPGGLYARAHVRAYARAVLLDPGLLAQLERDLKASVPIEAVPERPRAATVLTRTRGLIQIGFLQAAAYARNFTSWSQQQVAHVRRIILTRSAKI